MSTAYFRFYGDLNDFLPHPQQAQIIAVPLKDRTTVKHPIESLGVPHPEVEIILANGQSVDFAYRLQAEDQIDVYPSSLTPDLHLKVMPFMPLRPPLIEPVCFVLDTHLGQLATYLRLFGFDALYRNDYHDPELAEISSAQTRVLLTRDRGLLKRKIVVYGHCVRNSDPHQQLIDVLRRYHLKDWIQRWQRCLNCNGVLESVDKATILDQLEPKTRLYYTEFRRCSNCGQIYWQGSHYVRMEGFTEEVMRVL